MNAWHLDDDVKYSVLAWKSSDLNKLEKKDSPRFVLELFEISNGLYKGLHQNNL